LEQSRYHRRPRNGVHDAGHCENRNEPVWNAPGSEVSDGCNDENSRKYKASRDSQWSAIERPHPLCDQLNEFPIAENFAEILLPKNVTAVIATIAMNATRIPYSANAAPSSLVTKRRAADVIRATATSMKDWFEPRALKKTNPTTNR
jgi:hypothetical protein